MLTETLTPSPPVDCVAGGRLWRNDGRQVEWRVSDTPVPYEQAHEAMKTRAAAIAAGEAGELVWLLEHPPLYTAGTSARPEDLLEPDRFPVFATGRGGRYTYHGPGQRVVYVMLDLRERGRDVRCFVQGLERVVIDALSSFNIRAVSRDGERVGVWVARPDRGAGREDKIAAIGVRVSRWVSYHGLALNVAPDLGHFSGIVPCGITDQGVTSIEDLGRLASMHDVDVALRAAFERSFGPTRNS